MLAPPNVWRKRQAMPLPLLLCGKRGHQALNAASSLGESARSRIWHCRQRNPPTSPDRQRLSSGFTLQAVNRTSIKTYGQRMLKLHLGLRRSFSHIFVVSEVPYSIIEEIYVAAAYQLPRDLTRVQPITPPPMSLPSSCLHIFIYVISCYFM